MTETGPTRPNFFIACCVHIPNNAFGLFLGIPECSVTHLRAADHRLDLRVVIILPNSCHTGRMIP